MIKQDEELLCVLRAVRRSLLSAISQDPPRDWRNSLSDAIDAIDATLESLPTTPKTRTTRNTQ